MQLPKPILRYWLALNASALEAGLHAVTAYLGVAGAHAAVGSIPALQAGQLAAVFGISCGRGILNYLEAHPVTELLAQAERDSTDSTGAKGAVAAGGGNQK